MAFSYFSKLPIIEYPIGATADKKGRDILHRLFFDQKLVDKSEYLKEYEVRDGDRPEIISHKVYDRTDLYSIIMLINDFDSPVLMGLPPNSFVYDDFVRNKYHDDVYYLLPPDSSLGASGTGLCGGYVYPMLGYGFSVGEKVFGTLPGTPYQDYSVRAYVKEWSPVGLSVKLDVLAGEFKAGVTLVNESNSTLFVVGHKKRGPEALHHFEARLTTTKGSPLVKGSLVDPLSRIGAFAGGVTITPMGVYKGVTGDYANSLTHYYNRYGNGLTGGVAEFIEPITNQQYEERVQEKKRRIFIPTDELRLRGQLVTQITDIIESIPREST